MQDSVPKVLKHLEALSLHVSTTAAEILQKMKFTKIQEILGRFNM